MLVLGGRGGAGGGGGFGLTIGMALEILRRGLA